MITYNIDLKFIIIVAVIVFFVVRNLKLILSFIKSLILICLIFYVILNHDSLWEKGKEQYQYVDNKVNELDLKCQIDTTTKEVKIIK